MTFQKSKLFLLPTATITFLATGTLFSSGLARTPIPEPQPEDPVLPENPNQPRPDPTPPLRRMPQNRGPMIDSEERFGTEGGPSTTGPTDPGNPTDEIDSHQQLDRHRRGPIPPQRRNSEGGPQIPGNQEHRFQDKPIGGSGSDPGGDGGEPQSPGGGGGGGSWPPAMPINGQ